MSLFPGAHSLRHSVVVKEALKCSKQHIIVHPEFALKHAVCKVGQSIIWLTMSKSETLESAIIQSGQSVGNKSDGKNQITRGPKNFSAKKQTYKLDSVCASSG